MNPIFFNKHVGPNCERPLEVRAETAEDGKPLVALESDLSGVALTPNQAKALGRALIKAGKFVEKEAAK